MYEPESLAFIILYNNKNTEVELWFYVLLNLWTVFLNNENFKMPKKVVCGLQV